MLKELKSKAERVEDLESSCTSVSTEHDDIPVALAKKIEKP